MRGLGRPRPGDRAGAGGIPRVVPVYTTFGNHDPLEILARLQESGRVAGSAGPGRRPRVRRPPAGGDRRHLGQVAREAALRDRCRRRPAAARIARAGPVDILLTHGCPIGLADLTPTGRHGGQRCFLEAFKTISPRLHLCGHLHLAQEHILKDGRKVINVGATPEGSIVVVEFDAKRKTLDAKLERHADIVSRDRRASSGLL